MRSIGALVCVLLLATGGAVGATGASVLATDTPAPDDTVIRVAVDRAGNANWTIRYRYRLDDDNATAAFDELAADIRANRSTYVDRFRDRMRTTVANAENATGRGMAVTTVSVNASREQLPQEYGVVTYRFGWKQFASRSGDELLVGDAIGGLFLDGDTTLVVAWPTGYAPATVAPDPSDRGDRSVRWSGPREFATDRPRITLQPTPATAAGDEDGSRSPVADNRGVVIGTAALVAIVLVVLSLLLAGGLWYRRQDATAGSEPPEELLSDEERVLDILKANEGRMKQAAVAEALDWTDAKTSRVLNAMHEAGDVEKFRLGRENVVALPEAREEGE